MDKDKVTVNTSSGIGLMSMLFLVFLVLKLTAVIDWSWWYVTAPLWCPITVFIGSLALGLGGGLLYLWLKEKWDARKEKLKDD